MNKITSEDSRMAMTLLRLSTAWQDSQMDSQALEEQKHLDPFKAYLPVVNQKAREERRMSAHVRPSSWPWKL